MSTETKIITISSGKGGVGKTCISVNLAILLAQQGFKTCLFDADTNLANINIMLNLVPNYTLEQVINGEKTLTDITLHKSGVDIIPGYSGISDFISLTTEQQQRLISSLKKLKEDYDYLIIDNPAGISKNVLSFIKFSHHNIVVITPEPTSLTDAFSLIRVANRNDENKSFHVVVNQVINSQHANKIFKRFSKAVDKYIGCKVISLGHIVSDDMLTSSVLLQNPVILQHPSSASSYCLKKIFTKIESLPPVKLAPAINRPSPKAAFNTQPEFSTPSNAASVVAIDNTTLVDEQLPLEALKEKLIDFIDNEKITQHELNPILVELNNSYIQRFAQPAIELENILHQTFIHQDLSMQSFLDKILSTLKFIQQDQRRQSSQINTAQSVRQLADKTLSDKAIDSLSELLQKQTAVSPQGLSNNFEEEDTTNELLDSIHFASLADS